MFYMETGETMLYKTAPLSIVDLPAAANHKGGARTFPPRFIFLHHTGGTDSRDWLTRTSVPPVSCHRLIWPAGTIFKLMSDADRSWTQGNGVMGVYGPHGNPDLNDVGLSIELENRGTGTDPYPDAQVYACALQVHEWWGLYGYLPVLAHYDVDPAKNDPRGFPWPLFYVSLRSMQKAS